jgi:hypothetical protein
LARFDSPEFLAKTESLADPWLCEHALNVLKDGYTVIENAVPEMIVDVALTTFSEWKERNRQRFCLSFTSKAAFLIGLSIFRMSLMNSRRSLLAINR